MKRAGLGLVAVIVFTVDCRTTPPLENVNPGNRFGGTGGTTRSSTSSSGSTAPSTVAPGFDKSALLAASADCAIGHYRAFDTVMSDLQAKATAWANAPLDDGLRAAARTAWGSAMDVWEEAELFTFGPAAVSTNPGGQDLRDQIYTWPLFNRCLADEQTVNRTFATPAFATSLVSARALQTSEYLAFYEGADNGCSSFSAINSSGSWGALSPPDLRDRKAKYVAAIANDVKLHAGALVHAWDGYRDGFVKDQGALNAVNEALFYVEVQVKDLKIARPLGLSECGTTTCAATVESGYARRSKENLNHNFIGFRQLFQGCGAGNDGIGFDDWLRAAGAGDLADRMLAALTKSEGALAAIPGSFEDALVSSPSSVQALYDAVKALTDLLKTEFVTVLNLELPKQSEGDND